MRLTKPQRIALATLRANIGGEFDGDEHEVAWALADARDADRVSMAGTRRTLGALRALGLVLRVRLVDQMGNAWYAWPLLHTAQE